MIPLKMVHVNARPVLERYRARRIKRITGRYLVMIEMAKSKWSAKKYGNLKIFIPSENQVKRNKRFRNLLRKLKKSGRDDL